jgi:lipopolysaccharide/colanic/teichoic acid biosynthesis glycosyltransferase
LWGPVRRCRSSSAFQSDFDEILKVKPGITDYASIQYRNEESVLAQYSDHEEGYIKEVLPAKIRLYKQYIKEKSLLVDIAIIFKTLCAIVR